MLMLIAGFSLVSCAARDNQGVLEVQGRLAGQPLATASSASPVVLDHGQLAELSLTMVNTSSVPVTVAHVRLEGELLDLIFLTYDTGIHETIPPGGERTVAFPIDFFDLGGQVHGLLRSQIRLYDADRNPLGGQHLVIDGRGSPWATTSTFNLVLVGVAAVSLGWNLWRMAHRRLPVNRFSRGLRFLHSGVTTGLALAAAASTLRIVPLTTTGWVLLTVIVGAVAFALGYLSPGPDPAAGLDLDLDLDLDGNVDVDVDLNLTRGLDVDPGQHPRPEDGAKAIAAAAAVAGTASRTGPILDLDRLDLSDNQPIRLLIEGDNPLAERTPTAEGTPTAGDPDQTI